MEELPNLSPSLIISDFQIKKVNDFLKKIKYKSQYLIKVFKINER